MSISDSFARLALLCPLCLHLGTARPLVQLFTCFLSRAVNRRGYLAPDTKPKDSING